MRSVKFSPLAFEEFLSWRRDDPNIVQKILDLIEDVQQHPFEGLGKPEPLKYELRGSWSRRITQEDRLVYEVKGSDIFISKCRGHYRKK